MIEAKPARKVGKINHNTGRTTHGQYAMARALRTIGNQDGWIEKLGDVGEALQVWRQAIIDDLGGKSEVSAMELSVIELATKTHLLLASVDRFLLEQKSLINKSRRQLFPVVLQRQALANALAGYMQQLGLKRRSPPVVDVAKHFQLAREASHDA
jgi:hypothetical protein